VVYAGANDGMLHAFDEATGEELWAFVPTAVIPYLYKLADKNYHSKHRYYVDGALSVGDVQIGGSWRTVLIGGLGKGGRAYFALDVTNPTAPALLWEFASDINGTTSGSTFDDGLGYTYGEAPMTKRDGGTWVALFSSGYNNTGPGDGIGRLYVVDVSNGTKLAEIPTSGGSDPVSSGIGFVNGWTDDGMRNNSVRHVYAGDLGGRVWRFDIVSETATLLTTLGHVNGVSVTQPVTTRVELGDFGGDINQRVVYVGTGRYLGYDDITNADRMSMYAIRDSSTSLKSNVGAPYFRNSGAAKLLTGNRGSTFSYNDVSTNPYGWFMDFDAEDGERVIVHPRLYSDMVNLTVVTNKPSTDKCDIGGTGYVYTLNAQSNKAYSLTATEMADAVKTVDGALALGAAGVKTQGGAQKVVITRSDGSVVTIDAKPASYGNTVRRTAWRELRN
jgi:type IV pilus assembly protein PilY1